VYSNLSYDAAQQLRDVDICGERGTEKFLLAIIRARGRKKSRGEI